jgi:nicotinamide mononucleotide transporter
MMPEDLGWLIEPLAVITGIAGVALTVGQRVSSWPIGILSTGLFLALFVNAGLYADSALQVFYIVLGVYGWWAWLRGGPRGGELPVTTMSARGRAGTAAVALLAIVLVGLYLDGATDSTLPWPDATTTVLSVTAQILLTRKKIESWPLWILGVNVPYIAIYLVKGLALTAVLQLVFIALSVVGWAAWRRSLTAAQARPAGDNETPTPAARSVTV